MRRPAVCTLLLDVIHLCFCIKLYSAKLHGKEFLLMKLMMNALTPAIQHC